MAVNFPSGTLSGPTKILQVVSATKTDAFTTTGTAFSDVTGLSASITPSSTASKIFIICSIQGQGKVNGSFLATRLLRGSTAIALADAFSGAARATASTGYSSDGGAHFASSITFLDSPSTTSATTYKVQASSLHSGTLCYINRSEQDNGSFSRCRTVSSITVMEVAG